MKQDNEKPNNGIDVRVAGSSSLRKFSLFSSIVKKLGLISTVVVFALISVLTFEAMCARLDGRAIHELFAKDTQTSAAHVQEEEIKNPFGFDFSGNNGAGKKTKEKVLSHVLNLASSDSNVELSDDEVFLTAIVSLDLIRACSRKTATFQR